MEEEFWTIVGYGFLCFGLGVVIDKILLCGIVIAAISFLLAMIVFSYRLFFSMKG